MPEYKKCDMCGAEILVLGRKYNTFLKREFTIVEECKNCKRLAEEKVAMEKAAITTKRAVKYLKTSNIPKRFISTTFDMLNAPSPSYKKALDRCQNYCSIADKAMEKGYGIYIFSEEGRGKTCILSCMIKEITKQGYSCYIDNMVSLATKLFNKTISIDYLANVDFLFLDDIGTERYINNNGKDTWANEKIYEFINERSNQLRPTIFSSNLDYDDLEARGLMKKTVDRIIEMSARKLEIKTDKSLRLLTKSERENLVNKGE